VKRCEEENDERKGREASQVNRTLRVAALARAQICSSHQQTTGVQLLTVVSVRHLHRNIPLLIW